MTAPRPNLVSDRDRRCGMRLILFVADHEPNSTVARKNITNLCAALPAGRCDLTIVDVLHDYETALEHQILITPCLLLLEPPPAVRIVGTLGDAQRLRSILRLGADED